MKYSGAIDLIRSKLLTNGNVHGNLLWISELLRGFQDKYDYIEKYCATICSAERQYEVIEVNLIHIQRIGVKLDPNDSSWTLSNW